MGNYDDIPTIKTTKKGGSFDDLPSIYAKGGAYDQFGPIVRAFNPLEGASLGPIAPASRQPGAAMPFVGQLAASRFGPIGAVAGAGAGELVRQGFGRAMGVQKGADPVKQLKQATKSAALSEITGFGTGKVLGALKPWAKNQAIGMAQKILKPSGKYKDKAAQIAETALKEDVLSGNLGKTIEKTQSKIDVIDDQLSSILEKYKDRKGSAQEVISEMHELKNRYLSEYADEVGAAKVDDVIGQIERQHGLKEDVFGRVETPLQQPDGGFVIKKGSTSILKTPSVQNVPLASKGKRSIFGKFESGEIPSKSSLESPEDVILQGRGKKQVRMVAPRVKTSTIQEDISSPKLFGPDKSEVVKTGEKFRDIPVGEMQANKRGIYRGLESKRVGGGYGSETSGADIGARQAGARGYRKSIERAIPEEDISGINRRTAELLDVGGVANARLPVATRNNYFDLGDLVLGGAAIENPKALSIAALRKGFGMARSPIAKSMYRFGTGARPTSRADIIGILAQKELSPARRALLAQMITASGEE